MQYLLLIYHSETEWTKLSPEQQAATYQEYRELSDQLSDRYVGGDQLAPSATAVTVRVRDGRRITTDGPFAETKEQLGGYFLVNAKNVDEAVAIAARIPSARNGSVEVRKVLLRERT